ncbi:MAG TPA: anthranilate phosphoribosyltransferase [Gemmatimonadales bacterium]|nr:anthranilate phosphoribosyltransferase [Gemmatimonadales bacterium]
MTPVALPLDEALRLLAEGHSLSTLQAASAMGVLMSGSASHDEAAAFLLALRAKGESADEVAGAASALREAMTPLPIADRESLVDTCGTGGGRVGTLNISTGAAFLAVGAGVRVAKHGNRSHTSRSGSADVLEALGIQVELPPVEAAQLLADTGFTFLYAPRYHPAMRHVAPVRRRLGVPTMMNILGPLANPARAGRQVIGTAEPGMAPLMAEALRRLGTVHALVVHGEVGLDEVSPAGVTRAWEVREGSLREWTIDPGAHGLAAPDLGPLAGGEPAENAGRLERLLEGGEGEEVVRSALVLNAAAAVYVSGLARDYGEAIALAQTALEEGKGGEALARIRAAAPAAPTSRAGAA